MELHLLRMWWREVLVVDKNGVNMGGDVGLLSDAIVVADDARTF